MLKLRCSSRESWLQCSSPKTAQIQLDVSVSPLEGKLGKVGRRRYQQVMLVEVEQCEYQCTDVRSPESLATQRCEKPSEGAGKRTARQATSGGGRRAKRRVVEALMAPQE